MDLQIKSVKIIDKQSKYHNQIVDILIEDGVIKEISSKTTLPLRRGAGGDRRYGEVIEGENLHLSIGWLDLRVSAQDPGYESKEDLESLSNAAMAGGFTEIVTLPNTKPTIQTKEAIVYYKNFSEKNLINIHPLGAVTKNCEGHDFTEMLDLHNAGAVAFSDGENPLWNADIFLKTLQYLHPINALLMNRAEEKNLSIFGQMHEGITSTMLGMKGISSTAEELMIMRDLKLLEYCFGNFDFGNFGYAHLRKNENKNSILHFSTISTAKSVELIREAKKKGLPVSCDIAAHQLAFIDEDLMDFDTNLKVNPPFRSKDDIKILLKGLADGTIDAIVSDHHPQDEEGKNLEFDMAEFGIIGLQTAFSVANQHSKLTIEQIIEKFTTNPRKLLRFENRKIEVGEKANLTIFNPNQEWIFTEKNNLSKSKNSPFLNKKMKGKVVGVVNKGRMKLC